jgi:hypothetical protein
MIYLLFGMIANLRTIQSIGIMPNSKYIIIYSSQKNMILDMDTGHLVSLLDAQITIQFYGAHFSYANESLVGKLKQIIIN